MRKICCLILVLCILCGCNTEGQRDALREECKSLRAEVRHLRSETYTLDTRVSALKREIRDLENERRAYQSGREPRYIVKFEIKQGTFTIDLGEHIKNNMNAIEVEFPVNKEFYNRLSIGQDLTDSFKWGSLVFDGDFSNLHMRVKAKRME